LSEKEIATLDSLEQVDDYPLYVMHYQGAYQRVAALPPPDEWLAKQTPPLLSQPAWACSLFAALADPEAMVYGRSFDWHYSPAVLLFTNPPDGYASVSMVDIAYFFTASEARALADLPLEERKPLLNAPFWPFDGMNEHGLVVGMAAVPDSPQPYEAGKTVVDSLQIIREMLDHARNLDEAIAIMDAYNISWEGGPPLHYLIADASGRAVLVEFYEGARVLIPNEANWHTATNFLRSATGGTGQGQCWRFDRIYQRLDETGGQLSPEDAVELLSRVAQENTQWSIVYGISTGDIHVAMGRQYGNVHLLHLAMEAE
jgi:hypothetical protein